jgi:hypothetical protein
MSEEQDTHSGLSGNVQTEEASKQGLDFIYGVETYKEALVKQHLRLAFRDELERILAGIDPQNPRHKLLEFLHNNYHNLTPEQREEILFLSIYMSNPCE